MLLGQTRHARRFTKLVEMSVGSRLPLSLRVCSRGIRPGCDVHGQQQLRHVRLEGLLTTVQPVVKFEFSVAVLLPRLTI
jgi:hypothetical protein